MSIRTMNWVWEHSPAAGNELLLLLAIADNADDSGGNAWPSIGTLAAKTRLSDRTVQRLVSSLVRLGLLQVTMGAGRHGTNLYRVVIHTGDNLSPRQSDTPTQLRRATGDTAVSPEPSVHPSPLTPPVSPQRRCPRHTRPRDSCPACRSLQPRHPSTKTLAEALAEAIPGRDQ